MFYPHYKTGKERTLLHQPGLGGGRFPGLEDVRILQQLEGREDDAGGHGGMMLLLGDGCLLQATQHHQLQLRCCQTRQTCKECGRKRGWGTGKGEEKVSIFVVWETIFMTINC